MGCELSKFGRASFEIANETFTAIASGALGVIVLITDLSTSKCVPTLVLTTITFGCLLYVYSGQEEVEILHDKLVVITGCDTGLGYSLALYTNSIGFNVISGCYDDISKGALNLKSNDITVHNLDITDETSVQLFIKNVEIYLEENSHLQLWAVVNNAAIMTFGEFEWLTSDLIQEQIQVNLFGTMLFTKHICPLIRLYRGRIITVSSHCAQAVLPGLSVYGATKSAISGWSDGIRVELSKYGIKVITFIPGSFVTRSNIMSKQVDKFYEMQSNFTNEQKDFYGDYFKRYASYLSLIRGPESPEMIDDSSLYKTYDKALRHMKPRAKYVNETLHYKMFHYLFRFTPTFVRDHTMGYFMKMPEYRQQAQNIIA